MNYTVLKSMVMSGARIAKIGDVLPASAFKGREKQLAILIKEGVLARGAHEVEVPALDVQRADQHLPPLPTEEDRNGQRVLSPRFQVRNGDQSKNKQKLDQIKKLQEIEKKRLEVQRSGASAELLPEEREALLAAHEGQELSIEEARALGLVK